MALKTLRPGLTLDSEAADSWARMEHARGSQLDVNRSTVPRNVQMKMYNDWNDYVNHVGPKPNHGRAIHPDYSWHCEPRAKAVDTDDDRWIREHPEFGWRFVVSGERWHAQYYPQHDKFYNTGSPTTTKEDEEEMFVNIQGKAGVRKGGLHYIADGKATFLGGTGTGVPNLSFEQGSALAKRVTGIGG